METTGHPALLDSMGLRRGANSHAPAVVGPASTANRKCSAVVLEDLEKLLKVKPRQGIKQPSFADVLCSVRNQSFSPTGGRASSSFTGAVAQNVGASRTSIQPQRSSLGSDRSSSLGSYTAKVTDEFDEDGGSHAFAPFSRALHSTPQSPEEGYGDSDLDANSTLLGEVRLKYKSTREDCAGCGDDGSKGEEQNEEGDGGENEENEDIFALQELLQSREDDLRMAAIIGQKLLDTQESLTVDLEVAREEKWVADCELNALKRDLKHAMSRVEQLQDIEDERSRLELELTNGNIHDVEETEDLRLTSWSSLPKTCLYPIDGESLPCVRRSSSIATSVTASAASAVAAAANQKVTTLCQHVDNLEIEKRNLEEKLVEAKLEVAATQRLSVHWRKSKTESVSNNRRPRCRSKSAGDDDAWNFSPQARNNGIDGKGETASSGHPTAVGKRWGGEDTRPSPWVQKDTNANGESIITTEGKVQATSRGEGTRDILSRSIVLEDGVERETVARFPTVAAEVTSERAGAHTATGEKLEATTDGNDALAAYVKRQRQQQQQQQQLQLHVTRDATIKALRAQVQELSAKLSGADLAHSQLHRLYHREKATVMELQRKFQATYGATQDAAALAAAAVTTDEEEDVVAAPIVVASIMADGADSARRMVVEQRNVSDWRGGDSMDDSHRPTQGVLGWIAWLWQLLTSECGVGVRGRNVSGDSQESQLERVENQR